jgi:hypothetical protein
VAYALGAALLNLHREAGALRVFEARLEEARDDPLAHYGLAWYHLNRREFPEARRELERAAQLGLETAEADLAWAVAREREIRDLRAADRAANGMLGIGLVAAASGVGAAWFLTRRL